MSPAIANLAARSEVRLAELPPLSLYVHIPWCLKKCPYCDFNSHEKRGELPEAEYVDALVADLEASLPDIWGRRLHTIFIGGGTPSLFSPESIDRLLTAVRTRLPVDPDTEVTMEANPGTFEAEKFRGFRAAGVNRLSVGVQSFDDAMLAAIGRVHGADEARRALAMALETFPSVNADLMYACRARPSSKPSPTFARRSRWACRMYRPITSRSSPTRTSIAFRRSFPTTMQRPTCRTASSESSPPRAMGTTRPRRSPSPARRRATT